VRVVVASAEGGGAAVKRPWLGAKLQIVTADIADSMGLQRPSGALVASVVSGGPAEKAGLKSGDLVVSIDGASIDDPNAFGYRFATKPLGGTAQLGILRQGRSMTLPIALQSLPDTPRQEVQIKARSPFSGATVANLSPALADELRLDAQTEGVVITAVADGSAAQSVGFQKGDVVVTVNNEKINRSADLERVTSAGGRQWRITILRGGQQISVMFSG
jgi:S1-C subfamily serine protease